MARRKRSIPKEVRKLVSPEHLARLEEALEHFDCSYHELMDHIKSLGDGDLPRAAYASVNKAVKDTMGKSRGQVYRDCDDEEMEIWGQGYDETKANMYDLEDPAGVAQYSFISVLMLNGLMPYEDE